MKYKELKKIVLEEYQKSKSTNKKNILYENTIMSNKDMKKVETFSGYDFYKGKDENDKEIFNIVPNNAIQPTEGYYNSETISKIKKVPNLFKKINESNINNINHYKKDLLEINSLVDNLKKANRKIDLRNPFINL